MFFVGPSKLLRKPALIRLKKYNSPIQVMPAKSGPSGQPDRTNRPRPLPLRPYLDRRLSIRQQAQLLRPMSDTDPPEISYAPNCNGLLPTTFSTAGCRALSSNRPSSLSWWALPTPSTDDQPRRTGLAPHRMKPVAPSVPRLSDRIPQWIPHPAAEPDRHADDDIL